MATSGYRLATCGPDIDEIPEDNEIPGEHQLEDEEEEGEEKDGGYSSVVPAPCLLLLSRRPRSHASPKMKRNKIMLVAYTHVAAIFQPSS
jgi:hypothetical protein